MMPWIVIAAFLIFLLINALGILGMALSLVVIAMVVLVTLTFVYTA